MQVSICSYFIKWIKIYLKKNILLSTDISVKDFADAKSTHRIRKKVGNSIKRLDTNIEVHFDALDDDVDDDVNTGKKSAKNKLSSKDEMENQNYSIYSNDIWFLISEYIQPEDVMRFALICRQTYAITTTMKFWRNMYQRFYKANMDLPIRLQSGCMARPGGIRPCTIRSLFFTYPLFVDRSESQQDFHNLTKRRVVQYWYQQVSTEKFFYFYKLKRSLAIGSCAYESEQLQRKNCKSIKALRDVFSNSEEGCSLLLVRYSISYIQRINDQISFILFS